MGKANSAVPYSCNKGRHILSRETEKRQSTLPRDEHITGGGQREEMCKSSQIRKA
jgi:hypothetical protein